MGWNSLVRFAKYASVPYTRGQGILLNPKENGLPHMIGVDEKHLGLFGDAVFDFAYICQQAKAPISECWRVIKPGGYLVTLTPRGVFDELSANRSGLDFIENEPVGGWAYQIVGKRKDKNITEPWRKRKPEKTACVVRYGGFGDMIQMSSVLPLLRREGYHVTVNTDPAGMAIVEHDPHIDAFLLQDKDQVPNLELTEYWAVMASRFNRFINLSESVEGSLLAIQGRPASYWPNEARRMVLDHNYLEFTHTLAGVPHEFHPKFYPTKFEAAWARKELKAAGSPVVMWVLGGSSVHKVWPYLDETIARFLLEYRNGTVILVGDDSAQIAELGWEKEPRVWQKSGKWSIRETLTLAEMVDLVIGPETGVLNAVGCLDNPPKICTLSHSSEENLTKHWRNCYPLTPAGCDCYPCHKLHYGFDSCKRDDIHGVALCQAHIGIDAMWQAMTTCLGTGEKWQHRAATQ